MRQKTLSNLLSISCQLANGYTIVNVSDNDLNIQYNYCDITLGAYANEDARNSDAEPMNIKKVRAKWDNEEFFKFFAPQTFELKTAKADESSNVSDNIYKRAYDYIKVRDEYFKEAKDC